jgi:hypothetical protein
LESGQEDSLLSDLHFLDRVNELLRELAQAGGGFREELTLGLPTTPEVPLPSRVLRVLDGTVRVDQDGDGVYELEPLLVPEAELRAGLGVLETRPPGMPAYYYTQRGHAAGGMLALVLYPRSDTARSNGVQLAARVSPAEITGPTSELPLQEAEERFLIPGICLALAETELSRGNGRAPVALWDARWDRALTEYADLVEDSMRGDRRRVVYVDGEWG